MKSIKSLLKKALPASDDFLESHIARLSNALYEKGYKMERPQIGKTVTLSIMIDPAKDIQKQAEQIYEIAMDFFFAPFLANSFVSTDTHQLHILIKHPTAAYIYEYYKKNRIIIPPVVEGNLSKLDRALSEIGCTYTGLTFDYYSTVEEMIENDVIYFDIENDEKLQNNKAYFVQVMEIIKRYFNLSCLTYHGDGFMDEYVFEFVDLQRAIKW